MVSGDSPLTAGPVFTAEISCKGVLGCLSARLLPSSGRSICGSIPSPFKKPQLCFDQRVALSTRWLRKIPLSRQVEQELPFSLQERLHRKSATFAGFEKCLLICGAPAAHTSRGKSAVFACWLHTLGGIDAVHMATILTAAIRDTGLVLEQQVASGTGAQSLLVDYVQLGTAYLVRALNDEGKLGVVTKAILKAQAARLGRLTSSQVGAQQAKYRLMRQVELIKYAEVTIETPRSHTVKNDPYTEMLSRKACPEEDPLDCLDIASLMSHIHLDPKLIGERKAVPLSLFHILTELGIQGLGDVLCRSRKAEPTMIDASDLKQRYGSKVTRKHQIALNRLTLFAHEGPDQAESKHDPIVFNSSASLPIELCHVNRTLLEADFARHKRSGPPTCEGQWQGRKEGKFTTPLAAN